MYLELCGKDACNILFVVDDIFGQFLQKDKFVTFPAKKERKDGVKNHLALTIKCKCKN